MNGINLFTQNQISFNGKGRQFNKLKYIGEQYVKDMNAVKYNSCLKKGEKDKIPADLLATLNMVRRQAAKKLARLTNRK